jgi:hypothetical protein
MVTDAAPVGFTVSVIESLAVHEPLLAVTTYFVVIVGLANGPATVEDDKAVDGDQLYVMPLVGVAPMAIELPLQTDLLPPADTVGALVTVRVIESLLVHPVVEFVTVRVYFVVAVGLAVGCAAVPDDNAVVGDQLYVLPDTAVEPITVPFEPQTDLLPPAEAGGNALILIVSIFDVSFVLVKQLALLVNMQRILSLGDNTDATYCVSLVPTLMPFFCH